MKEQVILREFQEMDRKPLEDVIRKTWKYDELTGPKTAKKLAEVYLNSCLANQTYVQVAVLDGVPVGVIMGKNIKTYRCPLRYRIRQLLSVLSLYLTKEGRRISNIFGRINGIDQKLLKNSAKKYEGEIAFFAVDPRFRGSGIGKMLFQKMRAYMEREKIRSFFLFTDTSCSYEFYEHQGMKRRQQHMDSFEIRNQTVEMKFFLYESQ